MAQKSANNTHATPSEQLVTAFLRRLQSRPPTEEQSLEQWRELQTTQPNIAHFIMARSYQAAPDDPELRSVIATNMLHMYAMLSEARLHEELGQVFGDVFNEKP